MTVNSWSFSKLSDFEKCKKYFWLKHDQGIPEPQRPLPPGKTEHANDRGTRIHQSVEDYVAGKVDELCPEAERFFGPQIDLLRTMHEEGLVSLEGEWGVSPGWDVWDWSGQWEQITDVKELGLPIEKVSALPVRGSVNKAYSKGKDHYIWVPPWLRLKIDALVMHDEKTATLIDYKTGRKYGNEVKHMEQLQLYQLTAFMRYPKLETIFAELWYTDQDEVTSVKFSRALGLRFQDKFSKRGDAVITTDRFPPNPSKFVCKWCQYGPWGSGHCEEGVR